jgi:hypothetical protein
MQPVQPVENPFALLLNPAAVIAQVERSERLLRLQSRVCRPLDKPLIPCASDAGTDMDDIIVDGLK